MIVKEKLGVKVYMLIIGYILNVKVALEKMCRMRQCTQREKCV